MLRKILLLVAALFVLSTALIGFSYWHDISAARARVETGSKLINTPCGEIEYADIGPAQAPAILAIHGAGGGFDQSVDLARAFDVAEYRVVAPSRFGYLRTPMPAVATVEAQADAHACLLDALGVKKVAVIGGSMGSPSAMQFCLRHPERCSALVLLFPIAYEPSSASPTPQISGTAKFVMNTVLNSDFAFWALSKVARDTMFRLILATPVADFEAASADEQARVLQTLRDIEPISRRTAGLKNDAAIAPAVPRYDLEHLAVPTLVIAAQDDLFGTYERGRYTAQQVQGAKFVGYPTGGHLLVGHRQDVSKIVREFLKGQNSP